MMSVIKFLFFLLSSCFFISGIYAEYGTRYPYADTTKFAPRDQSKLTKPYSRIRTHVSSGKLAAPYTNNGHDFTRQHSSIKGCPEGYQLIEYEGSIGCFQSMPPPISSSHSILNCLVNPHCKDPRSSFNKNSPCSSGSRELIQNGEIHCVHAVEDVDRQDSSDNKGKHHKGIHDSQHARNEATPICPDGQVVARSAEGHVCVDPVFPTSVCPDDLVPAMSEDGIQCIPCPVGTVVTRTPEGVRCADIGLHEHRTQPCPPGQMELSSPSGRQCQPVSPTNRQMAVPPQSELSNPCKDGEFLIVSPTGQICHVLEQEHVYKERQVSEVTLCGHGEILTLTSHRFVCLSGVIPEYVLPMCAPNFVFARLQYQYKCISQADVALECLGSEVLTHEGNSFRCLYIQSTRDNILNPERLFTKPHEVCGEGQQYDSFLRRCLPAIRQTFPNKLSTCNHGQMFDHKAHKCGNNYKCSPGQIFSERKGMCDSTDVCPPGQTFDHKSGMCIPLVSCGFGKIFNLQSRACDSFRKTHHTHDRFHQQGRNHGQKHKQCNHGKVSHVDADSQMRCVTLTEASELCGFGYKAIRTGDTFLCKMEIRDVICPYNFVLTELNDQTVCIEGECYQQGIQFDTLEYLMRCQHTSPICEENYTLYDDDVEDGLQCIIDVNQQITPDNTNLPCTTGSTFSQCNIPLEELSLRCNPECANGGTCINKTCICPLGITGHACHLDVDECLRDVCDYKCVNTFGSYHCECPEGKILDIDGVSCKVSDIGCISPCLNNGTCRHGRCHCMDGFEGLHCEIDIDECYLYGERLCQYQCRNTYGHYKCICPPGSRLNLDGRTCTNTTCSPECRNGGKCVNQKCQCPQSFYGFICQFDVNECRRRGRNHCEQICVNTWGSYHCSCRHGYILQSDNISCRSQQ